MGYPCPIDPAGRHRRGFSLAPPCRLSLSAATGDSAARAMLSSPERPQDAVSVSMPVSSTFWRSSVGSTPVDMYMTFSAMLVA